VYDNALVMLHHKLIYADCGAIAVIASMTYMTIMELIEELFEAHFHIMTWKSRFGMSRSARQQFEEPLWSSFLGV